MQMGELEPLNQSFEENHYVCKKSATKHHGWIRRKEKAVEILIACTKTSPK